MFEPYLYQLSNVVVWLVVASLKALPLIILIMVLRKLLTTKLPANARYYLWVSVLLCLTVPVGWQVNFDKPTKIDSKPTIDKPGHSTHGPATLATYHQPLSTANNIPPEPIQPGTKILYGLSLLWLSGIVFLSLIMFLNLKKFHQIKRNAAAPGIVTLKLFEACKQTLNPGKNVRLLKSEGVNTPIVMGWLSPVLLIPVDLEKRLSREELSYVFIHEFAHVKRQDILFNWIVTIVQMMHWFNPLLWLSSKLIRTDMEASCDAFVLSRLPHSDRHPYGSTLIRLAEFLPPFPPSISAVGILENHVELTERLKMISKSSPVNFKVALLVGLLLTASTALALTQPGSATNTPPVETTASSNGNSMALGQLVNMLGDSFGKKILVGRADSDTVIPINIDIKNITYPDFLSVLKVNQFTANVVGNNIQVLPLAELRYTALPIVKEGESYPEDQFITGFITAKKACAPSLLPILRPMAPRYAHMASDYASNSITLSDTYGNYMRIKDTVEKFDAQYDKKRDCKGPSARKTKRVSK